ncbi:MAG: class I SAM-dependent methyltransferase [Armatimonadota bacterium]
MSKSFISHELQSYVSSHSVKEADILRRLREETASHEQSRYQISTDQGWFMRQFAAMIGAKRYLEIGVFTGYSSLSVMLGMGEGGFTLACDVSEEYTSVARKYWVEAGLHDRVNLTIAPALETLDALIEAKVEPFDLAFIDPDKPNMPHYFERCLKLVRRGGVIMSDNVLWAGRVIDPTEQDADTEVIRAYNMKLFADPRVETVMLPIGDGLSLSRIL